MRLQTRFLSVIVPVIALALLTLGTLVYMQLKQGAEDESTRELQLALERVSQESKAYVIFTESNADLFASSAVIENWVEEATPGEMDASLQQAIYSLFDKLRRTTPDYREIRLLSRSGHEEVRVADHTLINRSGDDGGTAWFNSVALNWGLSMHTTVMPHPDDGTLSLVVARALRQKTVHPNGTRTSGRLVGYLVVSASLDFLRREIQRSHQGPGVSLILMDAMGNVLKGPPGYESRGLESIAQAAAHKFDGTAGETAVIDIDGMRSLVKQSPLFDDLRLLAIIPEQAFGADEELLARHVAAVTLAAIVLSSAVFLLLFRSVVLTPIRTLRQSAISIGEGRLDTAIDIRRDDEIGDLAKAFSDMSAKLLHSVDALQSSHTRIEQLAYRDSLTGLLNRRSFLERIERAVASHSNSQNAMAILFLDLDDFKLLNDSEGHAAGDRLLQEVAERLQGVISMETPETEDAGMGGNIVARLGGDEFVVLLADVESAESARAMAHSILNALATPLRFSEHERSMGGSIGIALFPEHASDAVEWVSAADMAMYAAKQERKHSYRVFDQTMRTSLDARLSLESDLLSAIDRAELKVQYQPQYHAGDGRLSGLEALLRWEHPVRGIVSPETFIPVAEDTGFIDSIGEWVLKESCRQWSHWHQLGIAPARIAVNVSRSQFSLGNFVEIVANTLREFAMPPSALELEITESLVMEGKDSVIEALTRIRDFGVHIAMDDFGTGHSSLGLLANLPIDTLKIDRCFITGVENCSANDKIVTAMLSLGTSLGLTVVAEGVETDAERQYLRDRGCHILQGFGLSRPLWEADMTAVLQELATTDQPKAA